MKKKLLEEASRICVRKKDSHPLIESGYAHYSFVVVNDAIIEYGWNHRGGPPPKHFGYDKNCKWSRLGFIPQSHSEYSAYKRARGLLKGASFEMINVRVNPQGELRNSCPCNTCRSWLNAVGCKKVYFSIDNDFARLDF